MSDARPASAGLTSERRIPTLDGLRGLASIFVVVSHYFGEVDHGIRAAMFGWIGVDIFFVLSGFLIGKLILEKKEAANFYSVFYARRFFRIIPAYIITVVVVTLLIDNVHAAWADADVRLPLWSYLSFLQVFPMVATRSVGAHWLAPTWTLAVEEHFYLVVPSLIVFTPRRWLGNVLLAGIPIALALRVAVFQYGFLNPMAGLVLLPFRADILICGLLAALAVKSGNIDWPRWTMLLRITPLAALVATFFARLASPTLFQIYGPLLIGIGCAAFLLCLVLGTPEAKRFSSKVLRFFGDNGYCTYLTHLPVLGLMHGLILGSRPDLATPAQWAVTFASLPVCVFVGWGMTELIEAPLTRFGRNWQWKPARTKPISAEATA